MLGYQAHIAVQNRYLFQLHMGPKPPQNVEEIQTGILIQNGRVLAAAKHPDTGIHSVEAKMSMIQWSHPGSRSHFVDPPSSKSICKSSFILFSSPSFCKEMQFCRHQPLFFLQCEHKLYDTKSCFEQALFK